MPDKCRIGNRQGAFFPIAAGRFSFMLFNRLWRKTSRKQIPHEQRTFQLRRAFARNHRWRRRQESHFKRIQRFRPRTFFASICPKRRLPANLRRPQADAAYCRHWTQIPSVPTSAFKELELTSIASEERTAVFHSSGTTEQNPSRHFHNCESLELYEASLWAGFDRNILRNSKFQGENVKLISLTPPPEDAPHSSLVHMFETVRQKLGAPQTAFVGRLDDDGSWALDFDAALEALADNAAPQLVLGTAFSFVQLLDFLAENKLRLQLPQHSRVMETGGYKNRSRKSAQSRIARAHHGTSRRSPG